MKAFAFAVLMVAGAGMWSGCQESLATPGRCPELCPGQILTLRDTVLNAVPGSDTTFYGYTPTALPPALLVSAGLPAGEARTFAVFQKQRVDSVQMADSIRALSIDSMTVSFTLEVRDSTVKGLKVYVHRIPLTFDSTSTFGDLAPYLTPNTIIDSILVPDSVKAGKIEAVFDTARIHLLASPASDSGRIGIGLSLGANQPTGIRIGTTTAGIAQPSIDTYGTVPIADTAQQHRHLTVLPEPGQYNFVMSTAATTNPDFLVIGGARRARTLIRFFIPQVIKDSASVIKATLVLTPVNPIFGLPNDSAGSLLFVRGLSTDVGAKSPILSASSLSLNQQITQGTSVGVTVDVRLLLEQWRVAKGPPASIFIGLSPEGGSFMQPVFHSTRSGGPGPMIRLTYALPTRPGKP